VTTRKPDVGFFYGSSTLLKRICSYPSLFTAHNYTVLN
jgi:hypothetical protein